MDEIIQNKPRFGKIDYIIVFCCIITIFIAGYDLYVLNDTEKRCLDDCNAHWVNEFNTRCIKNNDNIMVPNLLNFTYNIE